MWMGMLVIGVALDFFILRPERLSWAGPESREEAPFCDRLTVRKIEAGSFQCGSRTLPGVSPISIRALLPVGSQGTDLTKSQALELVSGHYQWLGSLEEHPRWIGSSSSLVPQLILDASPGYSCPDAQDCYKFMECVVTSHMGASQAEYNTATPRCGRGETSRLRSVAAFDSASYACPAHSPAPHWPRLRHHHSFVILLRRPRKSLESVSRT